MKKCKVALIANNYNQTYDGIGAFATAVSKNFSDRIDLKVYSSSCSENDSAFRRISTMGMTKAIYQASMELSKKGAVLLDYPFVEWNPCIIFSYLYLRRMCRSRQAKLFLSLHEYSRVNALRKAVIRIFARNADCVFVSNDTLAQEIRPFAKKIRYRSIPTNISGYTEAGKHDKHTFVYFGLVNKTKAFNEMLSGWDVFNAAGEYTLNVLTGSRLSGLEKHKNVNYLFHLQDSEILKTMEDAAYCIIPVRPEIDMKNGTFKTGALAGCICIGKFSEEYKQLPFVISMNDYRPVDFVEMFQNASELNLDKIKEMGHFASAFGKQYTPEAVAEVVEKEILAVMEG
jgi:hypothetical protein